MSDAAGIKPVKRMKRQAWHVQAARHKEPDRGAAPHVQLKIIRRGGFCLQGLAGEVGMSWLVASSPKHMYSTTLYGEDGLDFLGFTSLPALSSRNWSGHKGVPACYRDGQPA